MLGDVNHYHLLPGRGMVSDDTEHACMTVQACTAAGDDPERFARNLARRLRLWLLAVPAGAGLATVKATLKLLAGFSHQHSGVFSAGNGPAMRSPILGVAIEDLALLKQFVRESTRLTHTDPKAEYAALGVALAARLAADGSRVAPELYRNELARLLHGQAADEFLHLVDRAIESMLAGQDTHLFALSLGLERGVSGYVYHTVPVVLHSWLRNQQDFRAAVVDVIHCGGDTDTTGAIVGGIVGAAVGKNGIPTEWISGLWEWPRTVRWMEVIAQQLFVARANRTPLRPNHLPPLAVVPRNLLFFAIVMAHGFRRLLPPY